MRFIAKGQAPRELRDWFDGQPIQGGQRINCEYGNMPGEVKAIVKHRLLEDQGWLCCYTGLKISAERSHIEHLKPQSLCKNHDDVAYTNMLAAYPGTTVPTCAFGAKAKANWYDPSLFISPLDPKCGTHFRFDLQGHIHPTSSIDRAAEETISHLQLDNSLLAEMRKAAIEEALFPEGERLSPAKIRGIVQHYCSRDNIRQPLPKFCFVVAQVAQDVLGKAQQERKRKQYQRSQGR